jgi:hypothetical protein
MAFGRATDNSKLRLSLQTSLGVMEVSAVTMVSFRQPVTPEKNF